MKAAASYNSNLATSQTHGLGTMKRALKTLSGRAIDKRTTTGKALSQWKSQLIDDLGGKDAVSVQQLSVIDVAVRTRLLLDSLDCWLLTQKSLINHRRRCVHPAVLQRTQLADSLIRALSLLGLEKKSRPPLSLSEYLTNNGKAPAKATDTTTTATPSQVVEDPQPTTKENTL